MLIYAMAAAVCVSNCPGLSIVVVDETYSEKEALVKIPYEFLPLAEGRQLCYRR